MITLCGFGIRNTSNKLELILRETQIPFRERTVDLGERPASSTIRRSARSRSSRLRTDEAALATAATRTVTWPANRSKQVAHHGVGRFAPEDFNAVSIR